MGGVWLPATTHSNLKPLLWRSRFPPAITNALVSWDNPHGTINNSELELAGGIAHQDILVQQVDCTGRTIVPLSDNTPTVSWLHKGSVSSDGPSAYLLRLNSLHQRHYRYLSKSDYIPGDVNRMADDTSRLWKLSDSQLLVHFDTTFPQKLPWQIVPLRPEMRSALISALQRRRPEPRSFLNELAHKTVTGKYGKSLLPHSVVSTPTSETLTNDTSYLFSKYSPRVSEVASSRPAGLLSDLAKWKTTYGPSVRRSPWWGPTTHA